MTFPKIELHVYLEGTVRPETLLEIARRNDYSCRRTPSRHREALRLPRPPHFVDVWVLTTLALRTYEDFRQGRPSRSSP